jgi:hypothetical protein
MSELRSSRPLPCVIGIESGIVVGIGGVKLRPFLAFMSGLVSQSVLDHECLGRN